MIGNIYGLCFLESTFQDHAYKKEGNGELEQIGSFNPNETCIKQIVKCLSSSHMKTL